MSTKVKQWLASIPPGVRGPLVNLHTGSQLPYLLKKTYSTPADELPVFKLRIALGLDKASGGELDFRHMISGGDEIDWQYLRRVLNERLKAKSTVVAETTTVED